MADLLIGWIAFTTFNLLQTPLLIDGALAHRILYGINVGAYF